jgi:hypothetical protein
MKVEAIPRPQIQITLEYEDAVALKQFLRGFAMVSNSDYYYKAFNLTELCRQIEKVT